MKINELREIRYTLNNIFYHCFDRLDKTHIESLQSAISFVDSLLKKYDEEFDNEN